MVFSIILSMAPTGRRNPHVWIAFILKDIYFFLIIFFVNSDSVCNRSCNKDSYTECSVHIIRWQMSIGKKSIQNKTLIKKDKNQRPKIFCLDLTSHFDTVYMRFPLFIPEWASNKVSCNPHIKFHICFHQDKFDVTD